MTSVLTPAASGFSCLRPLRGKKPSAIEVVPGPLSTPCWIWTGSCNSKGYPIRGTQREGIYLVHRRVYEELAGPIAESSEVHHRCERTRCVNPTHLEELRHLEHARRHRNDQTIAQRAAALLADSEPLLLWEIAADLGVTKGSARMALRRGLTRGEFVRVTPLLWTVPSALEEAA